MKGLREKRERFRFAVKQARLVRFLPRNSPVSWDVDEDGLVSLRSDFVQTFLVDDNALNIIIEESELKGMKW